MVLLVGPRQAGKTTLAHTTLGGGQVHYFDAENPTDRVRMSDPLGHTLLKPNTRASHW